MKTIDIARSVKHGAVRGLDVLLRILTIGTEVNRRADFHTKVQVAQDLLDREGSAPRVSRSQATRREVGIHLTSEDLEELKRRAKGVKPLPPC